MYYFSKNKESGFTLIELLIVMTISLIILAAISGVFLMQRRVFDVQEQIVEMVQNARAAMDMMTREIRMAGYNPTGEVVNVAPRAIEFAGITLLDHDKLLELSGSPVYERPGLKLLIQADLNDNGATDDSNGNDRHEYVRYTFCPDEKMIRRATDPDKTRRSSRQPFAENIQSFTVEYLDNAGSSILDSNGIIITSPPPPIRQIKITITARTARPDPNYGGYRTHTLISVITPRNLGL